MMDVGLCCWLAVVTELKVLNKHYLDGNLASIIYIEFHLYRGPTSRVSYRNEVTERGSLVYLAPTR